MGAVKASNEKTLCDALVNQIRPLLLQRGALGYEVCHIIFKLKEDQLWRTLQPGLNWKQFLAKTEIPITYSVSNKCANIFKLFKLYNYTEKQASAIIAEFGFAHTYDLIRHKTKRMTLVALRKEQREIDLERQRGLQFHIELAATDAKAANSEFKVYGVTETQGGMRRGITPAFAAIVRDNKRMRKFCSGKRGAPKLELEKIA